MKSKYRRLPPDQWISQLFRAETTVALNLMGHPGHYRMARGWRVRVDNFPEHIFYFVLNGQFEATVDGTEYFIESGEVVITPPGSNLFIRTRDGGPIELYRFRLTINTLGKTTPVLDRFFHQSGSGCRDYFARIIHEAEFPGPGVTWKIRGLLMALLAEAFFPPETEQTDQRRLSSVEIRKLRESFHRRCNSWPAPAELAAELRLTPDYFSRLFRRTLGISPRRWMVEERIRLAALALVDSDQNVTEVADTFGYSDVFFFSQQFKKVTGLSPLNYVRQKRRGA